MSRVQYLLNPPQITLAALDLGEWVELVRGIIRLAKPRLKYLQMLMPLSKWLAFNNWETTDENLHLRIVTPDTRVIELLQYHPPEFQGRAKVLLLEQGDLCLFFGNFGERQGDQSVEVKACEDEDLIGLGEQHGLLFRSVLVHRLRNEILNMGIKKRELADEMDEKHAPIARLSQTLFLSELPEGIV